MLWSVLLIAYALLLHLSWFVLPDSWQPEHYGVLSDRVYQYLGYTGTWPNALALTLLVLQGLMMNMLNLRHRIGETVSLFPGLFYILVASLLPEFLHLTPQLMANTFYLLAFADLFAVYNRPRSAGYIYNLGLWIGLASLFYASYLLLFLWAFIGLNVLRAYDIRERLMVVCGILTPYVLVGLHAYWYGQYEAFVALQFKANFAFLDFGMPTWSWTTWAKLLVFALPLLVLLFQHGAYLSKRVMQEQKQINILYWGLLLAGASVFVQRGLELEQLLMLAPPMGFLLAIHFHRLKPTWAEFYHAVLLIAALFLQLKPLVNL